MGFWDELKHGLKIMGGTIWDMTRAAVPTAVAAVGGFMAGGPAGAVVAGATTGVKEADTLIHRLSGYFHPTDKDGTPNHQTIASLVDPTSHMKVASQALKNVDSKSPESVISLAQTGAKLYDGIQKHGSTVAGAKYAGATPISSHLASGTSTAIVNEVKKRTGFDAQNALRYGASSTRSAQMVPSTSAFHAPVRDYMMHGGAEAFAMKHLNQYGFARSNDVVVGGGA